MGISGTMTASPTRRSRSRGPPTVVEDLGRQRRARSKSRPRALYAPDSEVVRVNGTRRTNLKIIISFKYLCPKDFVLI